MNEHNLLYRIYRKITIKYLKKQVQWYLNEGDKKSENQNYRLKCFETATVYEKAINQIAYDEATEYYNRIQQRLQGQPGGAKP